MERTGNSIGAEGRRQHNEDDPQRGDKQHRQERLADAEIREAETDVRQAASMAAAGARPAASSESSESSEPSESLETSPQADGVPHGDENVQAPEGTKPGTEADIEDAAVDPERERDSS